MAKQAARTASGAAFVKAMEHYEPDGRRLFDDAVIARFLPAAARAMLRVGPLRRAFRRMLDRSAPGLYGGMVCRTRYIDDALRAALPCDVIVLGAGLDSRAYRMPELAGARVVEVDQPAVIASKQRLAHPLGARVEYVALDFDRDPIDRVAVRAKSFFIWEGVTQYLTREAVAATLRWVARAPRGSELAFTYVPSDVIAGRSTAFGIAAARSASMRAPWLTGFDPTRVAGELRAIGLELVDDAGAADYRARYLEPLGRSLPVFEIERVALARVS